MIKIIKAPGRINLIGEHTDYNEGYVMPVAIDREIFLVAEKREDDKFILSSLNFPKEIVEFSLKNIKKDREVFWGNYPKGVIKEITKKYKNIKGMQGVYFSNIPIGAGLSSSAAIEIVTAFTISNLNLLKIPPLELIKISQSAENNFVGVKCGIMDQFISCLGKENNALLIDCRTHQYEYVPFVFKDIKIVVCNTKVKRELSSSEYNVRRKQCEEATRILRKYLKAVKALRDVKIEDFEKYKDKLPHLIRKRAKHVIYENERVLKAKKFLEEKNLKEFGKLLYESHNSLKEDYEVSSDELDLMVEIAKNTKGVLGARMTGAGFGGCTINLVKERNIKEFIEIVNREYQRKTKIQPEIYVCNITGGVRQIFP
jgi:galactokinase